MVDASGNTDGEASNVLVDVHVAPDGSVRSANAVNSTAFAALAECVVARAGATISAARGRRRAAMLASSSGARSNCSLRRRERGRRSAFSLVGGVRLARDGKCRAAEQRHARAVATSPGPAQIPEHEVTGALLQAFPAAAFTYA